MLISATLLITIFLLTAWLYWFINLRQSDEGIRPGRIIGGIMNQIIERRKECFDTNASPRLMNLLHSPEVIDLENDEEYVQLRERCNL